MEVHCQVIACTKLFSSSSTAFGSAPNSQTSAIDAALPGTLPSLNAQCVRQCIRAALALHTLPQPLSRFERKHYFYADMPQGYQITQQHHPIIRGGRVGDVRIDRVQLEQDSGKSIHDLSPEHSHVDLNRAGMALLEVVTLPDLRSAEEAATFVRRLGELLRHVGVCRAQMEEGSMRVDVNVSLRREGEERGGERVEVKNLNSLRAVVRAIEYEAQRQAEVRDAGLQVQRETRTFDARAGVTLLLRSKEQLLDYRFMPEPDLPWLHIDDEEVQRERRAMGETREELLQRLQADYGLTPYDAHVLVSEQDAVAFFERLVHGEQGEGEKPSRPPSVGGERAREGRRVLRSPKLAVSWMTTDLFGRIRRQIEDSARLHSLAAGEAEEEVGAVQGVDEENARGAAVSGAVLQRGEGGRRVFLLSQSPVSSLQLASIIDLVQAERISGKVGKAVLEEMMGGRGELADSVVQRRGWLQDSDEARVQGWLAEVLAREQEGVQRYLQQTNPRFIGFLVGETLKQSGGTGSPREVAKAVKARMAELVHEQLSRGGGEKR